MATELEKRRGEHLTPLQHRDGICEDCGQAIAKERLEVLPQAARCVECQRREERLRSKG